MATTELYIYLGKFLAQPRKSRIALECLACPLKCLSEMSSEGQEVVESYVVQGRERIQVHCPTALADCGVDVVHRYEIPRIKQMRGCISLVQAERGFELSAGRHPIPLVEKRYETGRDVCLHQSAVEEESA